MHTHLKRPCPNCGSSSLYREDASGEGAPVLDSDQLVKHGDSVLRCDSCGVVVEAGKPAAKSKPAGGGKSKGRRPQASKRARGSRKAAKTR